MPRTTRNDYAEPGSLQRAEEAAYALADADPDDDEAYYRARARFVAALVAFKMPAPCPRAPRVAAQQLPLPLRGGRGPRPVRNVSERRANI